MHGAVCQTHQLDWNIQTFKSWSNSRTKLRAEICSSWNWSWSSSFFLGTCDFYLVSFSWFNSIRRSDLDEKNWFLRQLKLTVWYLNIQFFGMNETGPTSRQVLSVCHKKKTDSDGWLKSQRILERSSTTSWQSFSISCGYWWRTSQLVQCHCQLES